MGGEGEGGRVSDGLLLLNSLSIFRSVSSSITRPGKKMLEKFQIAINCSLLLLVAT